MQINYRRRKPIPVGSESNEQLENITQHPNSEAGQYLNTFLIIRGVVKMRTRRIILTSAIIICVLLIFVSINVALIGLTLVLSWTSYQLLIKKDYTLLQTSIFQNVSLRMPDFDKLSQEQISTYQRTAYRVGWWILASTIACVIVLICLNL